MSELDEAWEAYERAHDVLDAAVDGNKSDAVVHRAIDALTAARLLVNTAAQAEAPERRASVRCLIENHPDDFPAFAGTAELGQHILAEHTERPSRWWLARNRVKWTFIGWSELRVPLYAAVLAFAGVTAGTGGILH